MAKNLQNEQLEEMGKRRRQGRIMKRVFIGAAVCVAFFAIYALVLPASTLEHPDPACGLEEHVHAEECFETQLTCELPETGAHVHIQACYDANDPEKLVCEEPATGHLHTQKCFATGDELVCENTEADHEHGEDCYLQPGTLVCEEEETVHVHNDACYEVAENLTCTNEDPEHVHGPECTESITTLTCTEESAGHVHHALCYDADGNLTCTEDEAVTVDHEHNDACNEQVPACGIEEHQHDEVCYDPETLQMIQATKDNKDAQDAENAEGTESEDANESEETEEAEPIDEDELAQLKEQGLAWENENMILTFSLPEETEEEVRFEVTEQSVDPSELSEEAKNDENAWQNDLQINATKDGEAVEDIASLSASVEMMLKPEAVEPILNEINFDEVAPEIQDEVGAEIVIMQSPSYEAGESAQGRGISEKEDNISTYIIKSVTGGSITFALTEGNVAALAEGTPDPVFNVHYYADVEVVEASSDKYPSIEGEFNAEDQLTVIDTHMINNAGANKTGNTESSKLPTNSAKSQLPLKYVKLKQDEQGYYSVETKMQETEVYSSDSNLHYVTSPNIKYFNKLYENYHYELKEVYTSNSENGPWGDPVFVMKPGMTIEDIHFTNRREVAESSPVYILIENGMHIKLKFVPTSNSFNAPATFYDYDITDGNLYAKNTLSANTITNPNVLLDKNNKETYFVNINRQGINSISNYGAESNTAKYGFGNITGGTGINEETVGEYAINKANNAKANTEHGVIEKCYFGLVDGIKFSKENEQTPSTLTNYAADTVKFADGITGPEVFGSAPAAGKTKVEGNYTIDYNRLGDTYEISNVRKNGVATTELPLDSFSLKTGVYNQSSLKQFSNQFWVLDDANNPDAMATYGADFKYGRVRELNSDATDGFTNIHYQRIEAKGYPMETRWHWYGLNKGDNWLDHNNYFGMVSQVDFTLTEDYIGPLEYFFFGDDDMWVFLMEVEEDGETIKRDTVQLVCDIGGVHQTTGELVNLRDYLPNRSSGHYALRFYYTERGASGSTCYMRFTLPSVSKSTVEQDTGTINVEKKVIAPAASPVNNQEFTFEVDLYQADGTTRLLDDYAYSRYDSNGNLIAKDVVLHTGGTFNLKANEKVVIKYLPVGSRYTIREVHNGQSPSIENGGYKPSYQYVINDKVVEEEDSGDFSGSIEQNSQVSTRKIVFTNEVPYKLPETGGEGTKWFYLGGGLLFVASAALVNRRRHSISR